ncbi:hypothetical protein LPB140_08670 [Sphingorhabdus lutea]|uniref:Uncharacterized protein n=1 Tax=Sphingorhabdus lutea TaxID=1913578 RepID=A0A1L3JCR4_9SPHN|nr:hypothetical protein LPB140_08670 [Sphingorhabdus lutea]
MIMGGLKSRQLFLLNYNQQSIFADMISKCLPYRAGKAKARPTFIPKEHSHGGYPYIFNH